MNVLHPQMLMEWLDNMAINEYQKLVDICEWKPKKDIKKVVIGGAGPTGYKLLDKDIDFDHTLVVSNQSTVTRRVDIIVVTDSGLAVIDKMDRLGPETCVFAATIAPPWIWRKYPETYAFLHPTNAQEDPMLKMLNRLMRQCAPSITSNVLQAGMSLNAALLIVIDQMRKGVLPLVPIHLVGIDLAYESTLRKRCDGYDEGGEVIYDHKGRLTSKALLGYAGDLRQIVEAYPHYTIYCEPNPDSLVRDFVTEKSVLDE